MRFLSVITLLTTLVLPPVASAEIQTLTAMHTYVLGDRDSKEDARQRCLLETKRKILEQAGVYMKSASEVKNFDLTKDTITSFAAAVMQVKDSKENFGFENGHMTLTLTIKADVDLEEVHKQLEAGVRDDVAAQKERMKHPEVQLETISRQQGGQSSEHAPASPPIDISAEDLETLRIQAAQGDVQAQVELGFRYKHGEGVPKDYATARGWYEKAATQGDATAQLILGVLYAEGLGMPQDYMRAYMWFNLAATHPRGDAQSSAANKRDKFGRFMTPAQIAEAKRLTQQCQAQQFKGC
jgi:Sel1 repeat